MEDDLDQVELEARVRQTKVSPQEQQNHPVMAALRVSAGFP